MPGTSPLSAILAGKTRIKDTSAETPETTHFVGVAISNANIALFREAFGIKQDGYALLARTMLMYALDKKQAESA